MLKEKTDSLRKVCPWGYPWARPAETLGQEKVVLGRRSACMLNSSAHLLSGPPQLGHFCSSEVVGLQRRGLRGAEGNPTPRSQRERALEGCPAYSHLQFPACLLEEPREQGCGWTLSPQLPGGLEPSSGHLGVESICTILSRNSSEIGTIAFPLFYR